jgi:hypothetical protein
MRFIVPGLLSSRALALLEKYAQAIHPARAMNSLARSIFHMLASLLAGEPEGIIP